MLKRFQDAMTVYVVPQTVIIAVETIDTFGINYPVHSKDSEVLHQVDQLLYSVTYMYMLYR